jgi:hypothetical protein
MRFLRFLSFSTLVALSAACGGKTEQTPDTTDTGSIADDTGTPPIDSSEPPHDDGFPDVEPPPTDAPAPVVTDKLDLLFVVDNSISMADKQAELARAIPGMIRDLTTATPTTKAFTDVHVGVITSSLGSHGTSACAIEITSAASNDKGHLLPRPGDTSCATVAASPLTWTTGADATKLGTTSTCVVQSAKENGCGYEATLEAMYHFLVDPAPYLKAEVKCTFGISGDACGSNKIIVEGIDDEILKERAAFLRPDSTVAIIVLSDENDFSLKPAGLNWLPWGYGKGQMQRGWAACNTVPDDFEPETAAEFMKLHTDYKCFSCFENASDPNCKVAWPTSPLNNDVDGRNLRGFNQTKRFGYNFLWSRDRYVSALTKSMVLASDGTTKPNPLFSGGRSPANVIFAPIVGLPPNLVRGADGFPKPTLTSTEWGKLVGPIGTRDPHMVESIAPRMGVPKYAGDRTIDPVNGGDRDIADGDDLQYACIAKRAVAGKGNDCEGPSPATKSPLCDATGNQLYYKAFPGLRALRVAQSVNGFAASICDPNLGDVLKVLVARLRPLIK